MRSKTRFEEEQSQGRPRSLTPETVGIALQQSIGVPKQGRLPGRSNRANDEGSGIMGC